MAKKKKTDNPRILIVTPEITYLPPGMGNMAQRLSAKAGGLADVSASLVSALFNLGADVHVAMPNYRKMFQGDVFNFHEKQLKQYHEVLPEDHIHLAEDRIFYYKDSIYSSHAEEAMRVAMVFQREVINHIVPKARPDLIHCNDWMTALIPAMAKRRGIKSLFTVHNIHTRQVSLAQAEETGIDAAEFWMNLYFTQNPGGYDNARSNVPVDLLSSGIFASHFINTVSPRFLWEIVEGWHSVVPWSVREEIRNKYHAGCAAGILNAPDASYSPVTDDALVRNFSHKDFWDGKRANKEAFQHEMGLHVNADAPLFFWPSRLDPVQKGPQLVTDILYQLVSDYWDRPIQLAVVANGPHEVFFQNMIRDFNLEGRVAIVGFDERMSRLGYAASDFMLMPSLFEPCGLPQMTAPLYGSLPVVHGTGGLYDTIRPMDVENSKGNGFRFDDYDSGALRWAIDQAMEFHALPMEVKEPQIRRVIKESVKEFSHEEVARNYIAIYEEMLARPLVENEAGIEVPPS
ncbi:MAG: glycogen/starch synthase [Akkermansiaceae bacterium]|jgi:starch synthase|nr:glycogen/starch synthase [Akkermansiaceae bacterium]MDP4646945.1 glycogen/starch synthase [Akkermansiaceae bacterium]MDP4720632.1 glycogen/starch synthase [Akkermansiaceae bacterium]MDP4780176.1 glycogen/starch synthase [Akkermansiaceae bacterium]MDP4847576.1 glycogen/starch synthase [Akkermansiaceae bacterium]